MPRQCRSWQYVRSATGRRVRRCASYGSRSRASYHHSPPNKGAHCVALQRVYSHVLRRHVTRCLKFEGGRVGVRKRPPRLPNGLRCERRKKVYSRFLRKKVLRCAKYGWPAQAAPQLLPAMPVSSPLPAWVVPAAPAPVVFTPPSVETEVLVERGPMLLLPPNAKSLQNRKRMYRRLQDQMRRLKPSQPQPQVASRWPGDRPKKRG